MSIGSKLINAIGDGISGFDKGFKPYSQIYA